MSHRKRINSTEGVIKFLGGEYAVAKAFGIDAKAVFNWKYYKIFPANTYVPLRQLLAEQERWAPDRLWAMKKLVKKRSHEYIKDKD